MSFDEHVKSAQEVMRQVQALNEITNSFGQLIQMNDLRN
jgi:hypothetical protein